jgi:EAL domain-containing protein (putative c-di-GMP-specific phosphodiesterase class I)
VAEVCVDASAALVVESVIRLAHVRGIDVVAEGIENLRELERLAELHCDFGQGYVWTRSQPLGDLQRWLAGGVGPTPFEDRMEAEVSD